MSPRSCRGKVVAAPLVLITALVLGCVPGEAPSSEAPSVPAESHSDARFVDVSAEVGLDFEHTNGMTGGLYFVEPVGSGGALADLDGDGDLDVVLVQSGPLTPAAEAADVGEERDGTGRLSRIFRNDLDVSAEGLRRLRFTDVTESSGLRADGYGMGIATGDFDADGRVDLYFTNFGPNELWRNVGGEGRIAFENVTATAGEGVADPRWSTSATFTDLDGDGRLDLFVANYVDYRLETHRPCRSAGGRPDYCGPVSYSGQHDRLLWNAGDGRFVDITAPAGLVTEASSGLGVVAADFDADGRMDLFVANDLRRNFLWRGLGLGSDGIPRFDNVALERGVAVSMMGAAQASMGVVAGDFDNDGDDDLFMTHLKADSNTLYTNDGEGSFMDHSALSGLGAPSFETTGFGTAALDVDRDGWLDIVTVNGAVKTIEAQAAAGDPYPLKEPNQLFRNRGDGTFEEVNANLAGEAFARLEVSRGLAVGDVDNDGDGDLLQTNNQGPSRLLLAQTREGDGAWIGLRVLLREGGRDALGARVEVARPDEARAESTKLRRRVATDGSYLSAGDPRVLFGLGADPGSVDVRIEWPGGRAESFAGLATGRYHTLVAGRGVEISNGSATHEAATRDAAP